MSLRQLGCLRALLDTKTGARYAKSLRQLAFAEYGSCFGGRCEACETAEAAKLETRE